MVATDPTMQLIQSLDDPALFERKEKVAVFKPHKRSFPAVKLGDKTLPAQDVEVTGEDLKIIAANVNKLYQEDGQLVKLVVGHRKLDPKQSETNQPPVVGYAKDYKAEVVQRPGGPVLRLTHTEYVHRHKPQSAAVLNGEYPERSPEYDPERKVITGVALLTRDQALPLGTVSYDAAENRLLYAMENEAMTDETMNDDEKKFYALFERCMKKYSAGSAAGATNGTVATPVDYSADPVILSLQAEIERERAATAEANKSALTERCKGLLNTMTDLRKFNYEHELERLTTLPDDAARSAHVHYMMTNYLPLPSGGMIRTAPTVKLPDPVNDSLPDFAKAPKGHGAACQYMLANPGMQYDEAMKKVNAA